MDITVIDSPCGSGKTTKIIQMINASEDTSYVYITPYLSEVQRIKTECQGKKFLEPRNFGDGKLNSFNKLLQKGMNVVSTHALFKVTNEETRAQLESKNYVLILDEVLDVVEQINLGKNDVEILLSTELIKIHDDYLVTWNEEKIDYDTKYNDLKELCKQNSVFLIGNCLLMWTFPVEIFEAFSKVYILTYMFDGQIQRAYYDLYNIQYEYKSVTKDEDGNYILCDYIEQYDMTEIRNKIKIIEDEKLNAIGKKETALSKSWYKKATPTLIKLLKNNTYNFFRHKTDGNSSLNLWTTFKEYKDKLKGDGYTKGFMPLNTRASNDYADKENVAYLVNRYISPIIVSFFRLHGVDLDEDKYALSEMIQTIYRSRIRKGETITVYIPSSRMRILFKKWLNYTLE